MGLHEKLLEIQKGVDKLVKDGQNESDKYKFTSSEMVLDTVRPLMNNLGLLLIPATTDASVHEGVTKSGTVRFMTELRKLYTWVDCESGEKLEVPFYAQGVDLAGEKGVGKAETYGEKYFLMKFFHVPTKDDPDGDGRTGAGEKKVHGTQAARETAEYVREALPRVMDELYGGDAEKIRAAYVSLTKNEGRGYAGADSIEAISDGALPVAYGKAKAVYKKRLGKDFVYEPKDTEEGPGDVG